MKNSKKGACRANSLPVDTSGGARKKRRVRVSFSSLPPTEFEVERVAHDKDEKEEPALRGKRRCYRARKKNDESTEIFDFDPKKVDQFRGQRFPCEGATRDYHNNNKIDNVNEMLMDFLEEIEAESVTIENCLRDAVDLGVLGVPQAQQILPSFSQSRQHGSKEGPENTYDVKHFEDNNEESMNETAIEKLLDVFSTLSAEDLSKCCKRTLGKLCQLTSFEDYQITQISGQKSRLDSAQCSYDFADRVRRLSDDSLNAGERMDDTSSSEISCLSSESSDAFDHSPCSSQMEFCRTDQQLSGCEYSADDSNRPLDIKHVLPAMIDQGILTPRQVWRILESGDPEEAFKKLMKELSNSKSVDELTIKFSEVNMLEEAIHKWNAHNQAFRTPKQSPNCNGSSRPVKRTNSWKITPMTSTPMRKLSSVFRSSPDEDIFDTFSKEGDNFLEYWTEVNSLPTSTIGVLKSHGFSTEDQLINVTEDDLENLLDLSWPRKAQLWAAIEGLRLDRAYIKAHQKLSNSVKILNLLV